APVPPPVESLPHRFGRHPLQQIGEDIARTGRSDDYAVALRLDIDAVALAQSNPLCSIFGNAQPQAVAPARDLHLHQALRLNRRIYIEYPPTVSSSSEPPSRTN